MTSQNIAGSDDIDEMKTEETLNRNAGVMNPVVTTTTRTTVAEKDVAIDIESHTIEVDDEKKDKSQEMTNKMKKIDIVDNENIKTWNEQDYNDFKYYIRESQNMTKSNKPIEIENGEDSFPYLLNLTLKPKSKNKDNIDKTKDTLVTTSKNS